jgi:hypothetical protein
MLASDMNARYVAITLDIALEELRKSDLPEPTRGLLVSLLTIANNAAAELCDALRPQCAIPATHPSMFHRGIEAARGVNVLPFRRAL